MDSEQREKGKREAAAWAKSRAAVWMGAFDWESSMARFAEVGKANGLLGWRARRHGMGESARCCIDAALAGLAQDAIASSAPKASFEPEWGVMEIDGRKPGDPRSGMNFYPLASKVLTPQDGLARPPKMSDPRWADYAKCRLASALFRGASERLIAKRAAKLLVERWIDLKIDQALEQGAGELTPLMAMFERSSLSRHVQEGSSPKGPGAKRL